MYVLPRFLHIRMVFSFKRIVSMFAWMFCWILLMHILYYVKVDDVYIDLGCLWLQCFFNNKSNY